MASLTVGRVPQEIRPETAPDTLDAALGDEAVLVTYRRMFAALAKDSGAVVDDPALVDIAEAVRGVRRGR